MCRSIRTVLFHGSSGLPFSEIFKEKKVLIITSHADSINYQKERLSNIHKKPIFNNSTELYVYKSVQQNGGNSDGQSWLIHMEKMKDDISKLRNKFDFDVAFVSCGGFGMILCNFIRMKLEKVPFMWVAHYSCISGLWAIDG